MSVDKQNRQQITLQETIDAFAVFAISHNEIALFKLLLESLYDQGIDVNIAIYVSFSIPVIIVSYLYVMKYQKYRNYLKRKYA